MVISASCCCKLRINASKSLLGFFPFLGELFTKQDSFSHCYLWALIITIIFITSSSQCAGHNGVGSPSRFFPISYKKKIYIHTYIYNKYILGCIRQTHLLKRQKGVTVTSSQVLYIHPQ